jgi:hypothetical protein
MTWTTSKRTDVTFSLPFEERADQALVEALRILGAYGLGCTVTRSLGVWQGQTEHARTISMVGIDAEDQRLTALYSCLWFDGCEALQVESWSPAGYLMREVRNPATPVPAS